MLKTSCGDLIQGQNVLPAFTSFSNLSVASTVDGQHVLQPLWLNITGMKMLFWLISFTNSHKIILAAAGGLVGLMRFLPMNPERQFGQ